MLSSDAETLNRMTARENLQNLFDLCFLSNSHNELREHYRALRRIELNSNKLFTAEAVDISSLAESLTIACDILCTEAGMSFLFCGNDTSCIHGSGRLLAKSLLNLMSNAYLYGKGRLVTVKTTELPNHIKIEVKNEGQFTAESFGEGLEFVRSVCASLNGRFFIESDSFSTTAIMIMKKASAQKGKDFYVPDFCEYLADRLSPVYVEMFGMEYRN